MSDELGDMAWPHGFLSCLVTIWVSTGFQGPLPETRKCMGLILQSAVASGL